MSGIGSKTGGPDYLLQFVVPRVYRPVDLGQGDDRRPLGVRFLRLQKPG